VLPEALAQEEGIPMAVDSMRKAYARDDVREMIEAREKADRDELSRLHHARKQGLQQGLQQGLRQAAIGMVKAGLSQAQIKTALGVSQAELDAWTTDEDD
jgi:predicted transposase/invertase (TIGR01784 family)